MPPIRARAGGREITCAHTKPDPTTSLAHPAAADLRSRNVDSAAIKVKIRWVSDRSIGAMCLESIILRGSNACAVDVSCLVFVCSTHRWKDRQ